MEHGPGCLNNPNLVLEPGGFLESCRTSVCPGVLKTLVLISVRECHSNGIDELASQSEDKQANSKVSFF